MRKSGQHIGSYILDQRIGRGGMGEVWKARNSKGNVVALKILLAGSEASTEQLNRFRREADIMSRLQHRGICRVLDVGEEEGQTYLALDFLEGSTLASILKIDGETSCDFTDWSSISKIASEMSIDTLADADEEIELEVREKEYHKVPVPEAVKIMIEICEAVAFAHDHGVLHRDLKPDNIIITHEGRPIVLDFGIAKLEHGSGNMTMSLTLTNQVLGTMGYMAPEQADNNFITDKSADVYALGAILYQMISGRRQFTATGNFAHDIRNLQRHEAIAPRKHDASIPKPLDIIVMKALRNDAYERYQSVDDFREDLNRFKNKKRIMAKGPSRIYRAKKWVSNNRGRFISSVILASIFLLLATYLIKQEVKQYAQWGKGGDITPKNNGELSRRWIGDHEKWLVKDRRLIARGEGNHWIFFKKDITGDVALEFNARVTENEALLVGGDLSPCLAFTVNAQNNKKGYLLQTGAQHNRLATIYKYPENIRSLKSFSLNAGTNYHIRAEKSGEVIRLLCNGQLLLEYHDIFPHTGGMIGIYTYGKGKEFWNIKLYQKGLAEHASPLSAADAFWQASQSQSDEKLKREYRINAKRAYSLAIEQFPGTKHEVQGRIKRAYINTLLSEFEEAMADIKHIRKQGKEMESRQYELFWLLKQHRFRDSLDLLEKFAQKWPEHSHESFQITHEHIYDYTEILPDQLKREFLSLYATHNLFPNINCSSSHIKDVDFLEGKKFSHVNLSHNPLSDIAGLAGLPIKNLICHNTLITNLEALKNTPINYLYINQTLVDDLEPLRGKDIYHIDISETLVNNLKPLKKSPIQFLKAKQTPIDNIDALAGMKITNLDLNQTRIRSLDALSNMPLKRLEIAATRVTNLEAIRNVPLTYLNVSETEISDLSPLQSSRIKVLHAASTKVTDLKPLEKLPLKKLVISKTPVSDLQPLRNLKLTELQITGSRVKDLSPLKGMPIKRFYCKRTEVEDLKPLRGMPIEYLFIPHTKVHNLAPLVGMPLQYLNANGAPIKSFKPLYSPNTKAYFFEADMLPLKEYQKALSKWIENKASEDLIFNTKVYLDIRKKRFRNLRSLSKRFNGHDYLFVLTRHSVEKAKDIARRAGGHLVTITSPVENQFVISLHRRPNVNYSVYLAAELDTKTKTVEWHNGEKSTYNRFAESAGGRKKIQGMRLRTKSIDWFSHQGDETSFVIEWDD